VSPPKNSRTRACSSSCDGWTATSGLCWLVH